MRFNTKTLCNLCKQFTNMCSASPRRIFDLFLHTLHKSLAIMSLQCRKVSCSHVNCYTVGNNANPIIYRWFAVRVVCYYYYVTRVPNMQCHCSMSAPIICRFFPIYLFISIHIYTYLYKSIHIYTYLYTSLHIITNYWETPPIMAPYNFSHRWIYELMRLLDK